MKYLVIDFYEVAFGECVYTADSWAEAEAFCGYFRRETDGECCLKIVQKNTP